MIGQTISHYKIVDKLGEGGMGIVYKAEDTKLDRLVALKFLPPQLAASEQDKARFIQEAKSASALNHPNVCTIHDIQEHDGTMFIVMEYVDGQTLREKRGTVSFKQAIEIGIQIADGLAAAHEKGIIHRDIKPENIMIRKDGIAQIMDFGLAKLRSSGSKITRLTKEGSTIGTAGYMSPEQVQGQESDHRSDIFSYGVLLFELLTGQLPFKGVHDTALAYEIVNVDAPPVSSLTPESDPHLDSIVLDCLEKDPRERTQSTAQVALELKRFRRESGKQRLSRVTFSRPSYQPSGISPAVPTGKENSSRGSGRLPWIIAGIFLLGTALFGGLYFSRPPAYEPVVRSSLLPPEQSSFSSLLGGGHLAISPDGTRLAMVATDSLGNNRLWVRALNSLTAIPLSGTEGAAYPFWSPDNKYIGFFASSKLKKIEATGGPPSTVCDVADPRGATWGQSGIIVLAPNWIGGLYQVSAAGGVPTVVTKLDTSRREQTHRWPWFLPDGNHVLYFARSSAGGAETEADAIYVSSLDGTLNKRLLSASSSVAYGSGHILFVRQSVVMAQPFDLNSLTLTGEAFPIAEQVGHEVNFNRGYFSASENGVLVYQTGTMTTGSQFSLFDRAGKLVKTLDEPAAYAGAELSRDEKRLLASVFDPQSRNRDIWTYDIARGFRTRFTFDPGVESSPFWSADGGSIYYSSDKKGRLDIYKKAVSGEGNEEVLLESMEDKYITDVSRDGRFLLYYSSGDPKTKSDVWALPLVALAQAGGDRKPISIVRSEFEESDARFSPDGKWIAYISNESGRNEVYVRPFAALPSFSGGAVQAGKWQISTTGISPGLVTLSPCWSPDGKELYYYSNDQKVCAAEIKTSGQSFEVVAVKPLFSMRSKNVLHLAGVSADAQRFLLSTAVGESSAPLTLVLHWDEELRNK